MKRNLLCICLFFSFIAGFNSAQAQDAVSSNPVTAKNAVFAQYYGRNNFSLNFDRIFYQKGAFKSSFQVGLGINPVKNSFTNDKYVRSALPVGVSGLWGRRSSHLEVGLGFTPRMLSGHNGEYFGTKDPIYSFDYAAKIGYRYQRPGGGLFFRALLEPTLDTTPKFSRSDFSIFNGSVGIGYSF